MDYEKAYKDLMRDIDIAIEGQNNGETKIVLQNIKERNIESEDERIRKEIIEFINWANSRGSVRNDWLQKKRPAEWISYLEKQKEQQPAEWSEYDEEMISSIEQWLHEEKPEYVEKELAWLKSLRPQSIQDKFDEAMHVADKFEEGYKAGVYDTKAKSWKPSDEQMRCLWVCVSKAKEIHNASVGGYDAYRILVSLYDELHKLL